MADISFGNITTNNINNSPELQKRVESQENFGAIDTEKLKQDTVEISKNAVKENFIFKTLRNVFGIKEPKKFMTSLGLTALTVVGFAFAGNASVKKMTSLGLDVDKFLKENGLYKKITGGLSKAKKSVADFFGKSTTVKNVKDAMENKLKAIASFAKGTGQGFKIQFAYTIPDMLEALPLKALRPEYQDLKKAGGLFSGKKNALNILIKQIGEGSFTPDEKFDDALCKGKIKEFLKKVLNNASEADLDSEVDKMFNKYKGLHTSLKELVGDDKADKYLKQCMNADRDDVKDLVQTLTDDIAEKFLGENYTKKDLAELLINLKEGKTYKGVDFSQFNDLRMDREGLIGSWWPYNLINDIAVKFGKKDGVNFTKGSLGDALLKYNMAAGNLADTTLGKLTQNALLIPGESISNFCCDAAGMNFFLLPMIFDLFNTAQDAPKGQKVATVADDFVGSIGNLAISMPLAAGLTYGLASLKNIKKDEASIISRFILKPIGNVFGMGLNKSHNELMKSSPWKGNVGKKLKNMGARWGGGALRFASIMFIFSPMFQKPISALIHKVFGKPYDKEAAQQAEQLEEQKKQIVPELGITQGELMAKIEKNPKAIEALQNNPQMLKALETNPKILLDLLDGKEVDLNAIQKPKTSTNGKILSPANAKLIGNKTNMNSNSANAVAKAPTPSSENKNSNGVDSATYIPSSVFSAKTTTMSAEQQSKYDALMARSDKLIAKAEEYI